MNLKNLTIVAFVCISSVSLEAAIMSGENRSAKLHAGRNLLANEVRVLDAELLTHAPSPFSPDLGKVAVVKQEEKKAVFVSDIDLLNSLASEIRPTGIFAFGGENFLIFNEKKLKSGSDFGILYKGTEYKVSIVNITRNTYEVQLGEARLQLKLK